MSAASALRQLREFHQFAVGLLGLAAVRSVLDALRCSRQDLVAHPLGVAREAPRHRTQYVGLSPEVGVLKLVDSPGEREEEVAEIPGDVRVVCSDRKERPQGFGFVHAKAYRCPSSRTKRRRWRLRRLQSWSSFRA